MRGLSNFEFRIADFEFREGGRRESGGGEGGEGPDFGFGTSSRERFDRAHRRGPQSNDCGFRT